MSEVLDAVLNDISGEHKKMLSQQLGIDEDALERGIQTSLPVMLGGLEQSARSPEKAAALQRALSQQGGGGLGDILGSMLGGGNTATNSNAANSGGADILNDILGSKQQSIQNGVGKASGLDSSTIAMLMKFLGPMLMGALAQKQRQSPGQTDVGGMLAQERKQIESRHPQGKTMLGMFLDQDGDGDFDLSDVFKLGFNMLMRRK